jgi:hypothetical protein
MGYWLDPEKYFRRLLEEKNIYVQESDFLFFEMDLPKFLQ